MSESVDYVFVAIPAAVALALAGVLGYWVRARQERHK